MVPCEAELTIVSVYQISFCFADTHETTSDEGRNSILTGFPDSSFGGVILNTANNEAAKRKIASLLR